MAHPPTWVTAARALIGLNALIWFGFALVVAIGAHPAMPASALVRGGMTVGGSLAGAVLTALALLLVRRNKWIYRTALVVLACLAALSLTDQVGPVDVAVLGATLAPIACLLRGRSWYEAGIRQGEGLDRLA